jgi:hypothetical protein
MAKTAKVLRMRKLRPAMGWQIEYEIFPDKPPEEHPEIELSVSMEDSIHWFCRDKKFRVESVNPYHERNPKGRKAPARLFYRRFPEDNKVFAHHVNSGPARSEVGKGFWYKPVFEFEDGTKLDPHIRTT